MDIERPTADDAASRILAAIGTTPTPDSVDEFLAGDPSTVVTGAVTTMMATVDVLERAVTHGANFIITHEPAFWDHRNESIDALVAEDDPVYRRKLSYIQSNGLVIWHLHDAMHRVRPDLVDVGTLRRIGWAIPDGLAYPAVIDIEPMRLADLATFVAKRLNASSARYIGQPDLHVKRVGLALGFRGSPSIRHLLQAGGVDAVLIGEAHEWEVGAYAADAVTLGFRKALVVLGHVPSEQLGMTEITEIARRVLPGTPVDFIPCRDPYWAAENV